MIAWLRNILGFHTHYWGVPHLVRGALVQTCYECSKVRTVTIEVYEK